MTEFLVVLGMFGSVRVPPLLRSDTCISSAPPLWENTGLIGEGGVTGQGSDRSSRAHTGTHRDARFPRFTRIALKSLRSLKSQVRTQG